MKMIRASHRLLITALIVLTACVSKNSYADLPPLPAKHRDTAYRIPAGEIPSLEKEALHGDGEAAMKLCLHYEYAALNHRDGMYWLHTAAEDGNKLAEQKLGELLEADNNDPRHYLRSHFWLKKAAE